jgi:hypothetical protein
MIGTLKILDASGHLTLSWNPDDPADVAKAEAEFERLKAQGYAFFYSPAASAKPVSRFRKGAAFFDVRASALPAESAPPAPEQTTEFRPEGRTVAVRPLRGG